MASQVAALKGIAMITRHARGLNQGAGPRRPLEASRRRDQRGLDETVLSLEPV
jgi:hypothetical protein